MRAASKRRWARTAACLMPTWLVLGGGGAVLPLPSMHTSSQDCFFAPSALRPSTRRGDAALTKLCICERLVAAEKRPAVLVSPCSALPTFLGKEERHRAGRSSTEFSDI
jgi:hypothetical protein